MTPTARPPSLLLPTRALAHWPSDGKLLVPWSSGWFLPLAGRLEPPASAGEPWHAGREVATAYFTTIVAGNAVDNDNDRRDRPDLAQTSTTRRASSLPAGRVPASRRWDRERMPRTARRWCSTAIVPPQRTGTSHAGHGVEHATVGVDGSGTERRRWRRHQPAQLRASPVPARCRTGATRRPAPAR